VVGYHKMIDSRGRVKVGRQIPERGCAVARANTGKISILLMGDNTEPGWRWNQIQVNALHDEYDALRRVWPQLDGQIFGHRDVAVRGRSTLCPGLDMAALIACDWDVRRYWDENG
jgi:hypothetical protein